MSDWRLIALDMDGTLLNTDGIVSEKNRLWIDEAQRHHIAVTLATGRPRYSGVTDVVRQLRLTAPYVTVNGGEVWQTDGRLLKRSILSPSDIAELLALAREYHTKLWACTPERVFHLDDMPIRLTDHLWLKFGFNADREAVIQEIWTKLNDFAKYELTNSDPFNIEVNPIGVNKAEGLQVVCDKLQIAQGQVIAIGDSLNDVAMLKWAGLGVAMGNAQPKTKDVADFVTADCRNDGVAEAIQHILTA